MIEGQWSFFPVFEKAAVGDLLSRWKEAYPEAGVFVLVAEATQKHVSDLQALCKQTGLPVLGAIFPEIIHASVFEKQGLLLIRMDTMPNYILTQEIKCDEKVNLFAKQILALAEETKDQSLFLIFDAMVPNVASVLDGMYLTLADSVQYSGVSAGSETFEPMPCLFDAEEIIQDGVLAILTPKWGEGTLSHGYPMPDDMMIATSATGNCIQSIDWQPAFEVHQILAKKWYGIDITPENFYEVAVHFPFGIVLANGEILVRIPVALTDEGALFCVGEVPENAILTILHGEEEVLLESVRKLSQKLKASKANGLMYYCAGRRMHLGVEKAGAELAELSHQAGEIIGALSLGEVGMSEASTYPQFHNAALVFSPWWNHET